MRSRALSILLVVAACRPDARPSPRPPAEPTRVGADAMAARLAKLADEIDPGEQKPLHEGAPAVVAELTGPAQTIDASALEAPLERWETLGANASAAERTAAIVALARTLLVCETARVSDSHDRAVRLRAQERLYSFFDLPLFANDRSLFAVMFAQIARLAATGTDAGLDQRRAMELVEFAFGAMRRSGALHRHTAATFMREFPADPKVPDALDRVADAVDGDDPGLAVRLRQAGVELRGKYVTAAQLLGLARACYVAFDERCGDEALAQGKARAGGDPELAKRTADLEKLRAKAKVAVANAKATALEPRLARAEALVELGRTADAGKAHAALLADHPDDARVIAAAAKEIMSSRFDLESAYQLVARAPAELKHRNVAYLEIAIALRSIHLAYEVVPRVQGSIAEIFAAIGPEYARLRADVVELAGGGAPRGQVLQALLEIGEAAVPLATREEELLRYARSLGPRGLALLDVAPHSGDAWQVALAMALLSDDEATVLRFADRPVPADETGVLALQHVRLQVAIAVGWGEHGRLVTAARELEQLPATVAVDQRQRVGADLDAVRWRIERDTAARDRAIASYRALVAAEGDAPDARLLENLAALVADAGDVAEAQRLWKLAVDKKPDDAEIAQLQLHAIAKDTAALESIAAKGGNDGRVVASQWLVHLAKSPAERKRRLAQQRRTIAELRGRAPKLPILPAADGLTLVGTLQVGIGYATATGMKLSIDVSRLPRLVRLP